MPPIVPGRHPVTRRGAGHPPVAGAGHAVPVPADLPVTPRVVIPGEELTERFSRSSGPGGQGVNTTDSRVELVWDLGGSALPADLLDRLRRRLGCRLAGDQLTVVASERRSQLRNREAARERLAGLVAAGAAAAAAAAAGHPAVPRRHRTAAGREAAARPDQAAPPLRPGRVRSLWRSRTSAGRRRGSQRTGAGGRATMVTAGGAAGPGGARSGR